MSYAELQVTTNYSFLRGASHPEELFAAAKLLGLPALGVVDRNSVAGTVRCWEAAKATGVRLVAGTRVALRDGTALLLYPADRPAWSRLCRMLTLGKARTGKGGCDLDWPDLLEYGQGLLPVLLPEDSDALPATLDRLQAEFPGRAHLALTLRRRPNDAARLERLSGLARAAGIATLATGDVLYHAPGRPHPAGRGDLHPRGLHHRRRRLPARTLRRPPPEIPR